MNRGMECTLRSFRREDAAQVMDLVTGTFDTITADLWLWKYLNSPHFDESLVLVAENEGKIVGCVHYIPRGLKITRSLEVKGALGADFAVHPDYRQRGIGSSILKFSRSSKVLEEKGIILTYGFINYHRANFYRRNIDCVIIPLFTATYTKFFDTSPIEKRFASLNGLTMAENNLLGELREANLSVLFRLTGIPPFALRVENGKISVDKGENLDPDIMVEGDPYLLESVYNGNKGLLDLMIGMLKGRIRIRGGIGKILKFYRIIKTISRLSPREGYS